MERDGCLIVSRTSRRIRHAKDNDMMRSRRFTLAGSALALLLAAADARAAELTFLLPIEKGHVPADKRLIRFKQGDIVNLRWSTDRRVIVHLHGYDIAKEVVPGAVADMT